MRWFPYSSYFVPPIALYFSDHSLALLRLNKKRRIEVFGRREIPEGLIKNGKILNKEQLASEIRLLFVKAQPKPIPLTQEIPVIFAIPESQSFTHIFTLPTATPKDRYISEVQSKASHLIPVNIESLYWDWKLLNHDVGATDRVFFAGAPKDIIDGYIAVCEECNLLPVAIDMEISALARALLPQGKKTGTEESGVTMIVDMGRRTTTLGFFDETKNLALSLIVPIAGDSFTYALEKRLNITTEDAETRKHEEGMERGKGDEKTIVVLQERIQAILREINKASSYFSSVYKQPVANVLLAGGSSSMPGIVTYIALNMKEKVSLGNPFINMEKNDPVAITLPTPILFAPVIGLALHALDPHPEKGLNLLHGWEGERWEAREHKILRRWKKLALPIFIASLILLIAIVIFYIILPYQKVTEENASRISLASFPSLIATGTPTLPSTSTPELMQMSSTSVEVITPTIDTMASSSWAELMDTPTGHLEVRSGPGTSFPVQTTVSSGEVYPVSKMEKGWILLGTPIDGWVEEHYVQLITNEEAQTHS